MNRSPVPAYEFFAPSRICFGWGVRARVGEMARSLGGRAFLVHGSRTLAALGLVEEVRARLGEAGVPVVAEVALQREPEVEDVDRTVAEWLGHDPRSGDIVVALGGGSAIDLAKGLAGLLVNRQGASVRDYLEGVGRGLRFVERPLSVLAVPTTAGTGSEATKNAVISSYDPPFKKSLRDERLLPRCVLVDPELTSFASPRVTAHAGLDAITQLIESYVSRRAQPLAQALCLEGLAGAPEALRAAYCDGTTRWARERMAHAALLSGMALANSGLGLAHGVAAALGVQCRVPHGLACAVMLPTAMRVNLAIREAEFARLAEVMTGRTWPSVAAAAEGAIELVVGLCRELGIPERLSELGVAAADVPALVAGSRGNSMSGNPREIGDEELALLLEAML